MHLPQVNTSVVGSASNPIPVTFPSSPGDTVGAATNTAQFFLPGFDIPSTAPNPSYGARASPALLAFATYISASFAPSVYYFPRSVGGGGTEPALL